ncbi:MAG: ATP-grasp domain-containing protein [Actinomycetota bacterium]
MNTVNASREASQSNSENSNQLKTRGSQQSEDLNALKDRGSQKCIMILRAGFDQVPMIRAAKAMGLKVIAVDSDKNAPGFFIADENYNLDVMESEKILKIAREKKIDGITTMVSNLGMRTVAYVAGKMNLKSIPLKAAQIATDKKEIKEYLEKGKVPVPGGFCFSSEKQAVKTIPQINFPAIVKPVDGTKGRGISVALSEHDFGNCINHAIRFSVEKRVIAEEWIEGLTIGAECLIIDGELKPIILTDKYNTPPPKCVTIGLTAPSKFPEEIKDRIKDTAQRVADVLGLNTGAAHIDMIVGKDGIPRVIDVGPRLASGPVIFDFVPKLLGVDMVKSVIRMAIGEKPEPIKNWNGRFAASRFLTAPQKGCMYRIEIPRRDKDFTFYPYKELGDIVGPPHSDTDRVGCITVKEDSYDKTVESADRLLESIKVDVVY